MECPVCHRNIFSKSEMKRHQILMHGAMYSVVYGEENDASFTSVAISNEPQSGMDVGGGGDFGGGGASSDYGSDSSSDDSSRASDD